MTRDKLWLLYVARNPQFAGSGDVILGANGLRKLFEQTWDQGYKAGLNAAPRRGGGSPFSSIFGTLMVAAMVVCGCNRTADTGGYREVERLILELDARSERDVAMEQAVPVDDRPAEPPVSPTRSGEAVGAEMPARVAVPSVPAVRVVVKPSIPKPDVGRVLEMFAMHNAERSSRRLPILGLSDDLCRVAQKCAETMYRTGQFAHGTDGGLQGRLIRVGYTHSDSGENLAVGGALIDDATLFGKWMRSAGHRREILGSYRECGIGQCGIYWAVVFATPIRL